MCLTLKKLSKFKGRGTCPWKGYGMLKDRQHAVSGSSWYSNVSKQLLTPVTWIVGTSSDTGPLLPWGRDGVRCRWGCSLAAPATACGQCSSLAASRPVPLGWSHLGPFWIGFAARVRAVLFSAAIKRPAQCTGRKAGVTPPASALTSIYWRGTQVRPEGCTKH